MAITKKRRIFIEEYFCCGLNATEAARRAGYRHPNVKGSQLVKVSAIASEIQKYIDEYVMGRDEVLLRLAEMARGEHGKYLNSNGTIDLDRLIKDGKQHLVKKVKPTKDGLEVEFYDAQKALVDVGRTLGVFTDRVDVTTGGEPLPQGTITIIEHGATTGDTKGD